MINSLFRRFCNAVVSYNANTAHCCWWWPSRIKPLVYYFRGQAGEVIINHARPPLGSLNAGWDSFDLNRILTVSSFFSSKVSRACTCHNLWRDMETMDQILQGMLSLLLRCDLSTSSSLFSLFSYWIILRHIYFNDDVREIAKHDFRSVLHLHILSNAKRRAR